MTALGSGWGKLQDELRLLGENAERLRREHIIVKNERNELHKALGDVLEILAILAIAGVVVRSDLTPEHQHNISMATYVHEGVKS